MPECINPNSGEPIEFKPCPTCGNRMRNPVIKAWFLLLCGCLLWVGYLSGHYGVWAYPAGTTSFNILFLVYAYIKKGRKP